MEAVKLLPIIPIIIVILTAGCIKEIEEALDPDLDMEVLSVHYINETDEGYTPISDHVWTVLTVNMTSHNDKGSHPISVLKFFARTADGEWIWCRGYLGDDELLLKPGESLLFDIYFEVHESDKLVYLEYRHYVDGDPASALIPDY